MKYLNQYKIFESDNNKVNRRYIKKLCGEYYITDYKIWPDGTVDVDTDVNLNHFQNLRTIPLKFGVVTGQFVCDSSNLTSLSGSPDVISSSFDCDKNDLKSLAGGPRQVGGSYYCRDNSLTSLSGCPSEIGNNTLHTTRLVFIVVIIN